MTDWLFCELLDCPSVHFPREPFQVGFFEISGNHEPFPGAEAALTTSVGAYGLDSHRGYARMRTIFVDATRQEAKRQGRLHVREALILLRHAYIFFERIRALEAGYLLDLQTMAVTPFVPETAISMPLNMFLLDDRAQNPAFTLNRILRLEESCGELGGALRRSAHWSDVAQRVDELGEQFLMKWMAIECLCQTDPNELIVPKICAAVPLPTTTYFMQLASSERTALQADARFKIWSGRASTLVENLRVIRNRIAHSGYREIDLRASMRDDEIRTSLRLLDRAVNGVQRLALCAVILNMSTIVEMWARYGECLMFSRTSSLAQEVFGTVIRELEQPPNP